MLNLSSLFHSSVEQPTLLENLDLTALQLQAVADARTAIRNCLRENLPRVLREAGHEVVVQPRFFTQGSFAYKTLNGPARPPQQADIDEGAYLPLSFVAGTGKPSVAAAIFFTATEEALRSLIAERGWRLVTNKATCVRVEVASFAHIDIPLYAIPDKEFATLQKAAAQVSVGLDSRTADFAEAIENDVWERLPTESVLLAHRENDWMKSDPRPIKKWFLDEVEQQGEQLRRVIRYLKAFRDWRWPSGGPASILLMVSAAEVFDARTRRDDLALLNVVEALPAVLRRGVWNPVEAERHESLTERLGPKGVEDAAIAFEEFALSLKTALEAEAGDACDGLCGQLGGRFPNEPGRAKRETVEERVRAIPAEAVASPLVGRTHSA